MKFFNIHTHKQCISPNIVCLQNINVNDIDSFIISTFVSIGIHPWNIAETSVFDLLNKMRKNIGNYNIKAIGECGLDKNVSVPFDTQKSTFIKQLELASEFDKPVIVHCVRAYNELIEIKSSLKLSIPLIVHGYRGSIQMAQQLVKHGFYLSFGEAVLRDVDQLSNTICSIADNAFFIETDDSNVDIRPIYEKIALFKNISIGQLCEIQETNFRNILLLK